MEINKDKKVAAEKFAAIIKKLAEEGRIDSTSITIRGMGSDELFKTSAEIGIKELTVSANYCC